jgi:nucleoside-diphosphate-sugar epimerase
MGTSVLITGAAGFLGRHFVREHLRLGHFVLGIDDLSNKNSEWPEELPELQRRQERAQHWLQRAIVNLEDPRNQIGLTNWDIAYHFAAPVGGREKIENDPLFNSASLGIDQLFFRWAVNRVGIAVYPSSSAVYGVTYQEGQGVPLKEGMFQPDSHRWEAPDEMYGFTKLAGEVLASKSAKYGLNTLCIRPFSGYGPGQSLEYPIPSILNRAARREDPLVVWGTGEQSRDFVHVNDIVGATLARLNAGIHGYQTMNIGSGERVRFRQIAWAAGAIVGYQPTIQPDLSKPAGVNSRYADTTEMSRYYTRTVMLKDGLTNLLEGMASASRSA